MAAALTVVLLAAGCGSADQPGSEAGGAQPPRGPDAIAAFGYGPEPAGDVTYQPDVVLIGGGPEAIRSVSDDRMVWTLDDHAPGVDELEPGKVLFASSDAVGRILRLEKTDDGLAVTLAPVTLTEVVRDAHLVLDQKVSLASLGLREVPDLPGGLVDEAADAGSTTTSEAAAPLANGDDGTVVLPELQLVAATAASAEGGDGAERTMQVGDWSLTGYRRSDALGVRGERTAGKGGLKVDFDAHVEVGELHVTADVPITRGVVGTSHFEIDGITGLDVRVTGGAGNGLTDNRSVKLELPVQLTERVIIGGLPATLTQKMKFLLETAFTAKNGNLSASGSWAIDGPLGFDGSTLTTPTITERDKLIESIEGISVGVNGLVFGVAFEFGLLVGLPVAGAGPLASFITSIGIVNGSDLGMVTCRQSNLTSTLTAGVGLDVYGPVKTALKKRWGIDIPAQTPLTTKTIIQESWYDPQIVACRP